MVANLLILVWGRWKEENWSLRTVWTRAKVSQNNWAGRTYCTCEKQLGFGCFFFGGMMAYVSENVRYG